MVELAQRTKNQASSIRQILSEAQKVAIKRTKERLPPLINLSIGEPHVPANPRVMAALKDKENQQIQWGYSSGQGMPKTLEAIKNLFNHYHPGLQCTTEETMVTMGASGALSNIFGILVEKKEDIILCFEPYFATYPSQINQWGGSLSAIPTLANSFRPSAQALEQALQAHPNTKALILNYPNNPSGVCLSQEEALSISKVLERYPEVLIIIDDVYRDFNIGTHTTVLDMATNLRDRCVIIHSGSKGLIGAPSLRAGMVFADKKWIQLMTTLQTIHVSSIPDRLQFALEFAAKDYLNHLEHEWLQNTRKIYQDNLRSAEQAFQVQGFTLTQEPRGAFYLLIRAKHLMGSQIANGSQTIEHDEALAAYFLHQAGVATVPGSAFGIDAKEGYLRVSCAIDKQYLLEAATRMGEAAKLLIHKKASAPFKSSLFSSQTTRIYEAPCFQHRLRI